MKKVLIANRGEIAVRIISACRELGLQTVAIYSDADKNALHVMHADEAICIGKAPAQLSYLNIQSILSACEISGADAVHPGYGFLAESGRFAELCAQCDIEFIGPSSETIELLGNKARAKMTAENAGCPVIPGSKGIVKDLESALESADAIGFPLYIKASAGGGGRGIRVAETKEDFSKQFLSAKNEAKACFGCDEIYLEKRIVNPRHIEIQVLGDKFGNVLHLGERDCSIQRRRQKLIEEAPSPVLDDKLRKKMGMAAVEAVKAAGYYSAGTVEFLLDEDKNFYFMEVNTRIQVEHCVTEELTGVDLVKEQILIAQGEKLSLKQEDINFSGHVIEFRINAENPAKNFMPCPGLIDFYLPPGGPGVRVDSACYQGYVIPPNYDALIAKLIVKGRNREEAFQTARRALQEFHISGVATTISFHKSMLEDLAFMSGEGYDINTIDRTLEQVAT